jgi:hypothetical protein
MEEVGPLSVTFEDSLQLAEYADVAPPLATHDHFGGP